MARRIVVIGAALFTIVLVGLLLPFIMKARLRANAAASQNNLRELTLFAAHHARPDPRAEGRRLLHEVPAGTAGPLDLPAEDRLSWVVPVLPGLDQRRVNGAQLLDTIDTARPWGAEPNQRAARTTVPTLLCPENTPQGPPGSPALTCYVGVGGVGANAAALPAGAPKAGAMRYDTPTPFERVTDGLGQTLLLGETRSAVGPWLRGGPATVRGLDDAPGAGETFRTRGD
ncbi:MAG: DUF1559 domain-containing protein [Gemmata sp.]